MAPDCNRGIPASRRFLALCLLMLAILQAQAADLTLFDDQLQNGFQDWSWQPGGDGETDVDMALATPVHSGSKAIDYRAHDWNGLSFAHPTLDFATTDHPQLRFYVRGAAGDEQLTLVLQKDGGVAGSAALDGFIVGGGIASGAWREVRVDLREPPLSILGSIDRVDLQDATGVAGHANAQRVFIDDVQLLAPPPSEPAIFADSFEGGVGNVAPVAAADSYSVAKGGTLAPTAPGVLGNDNDANGDPLSAVLVSGPAHAAAFNLNASPIPTTMAPMRPTASAIVPATAARSRRRSRSALPYRLRRPARPGWMATTSATRRTCIRLPIWTSRPSPT